jgi:hypothetical protein
MADWIAAISAGVAALIALISLAVAARAARAAEKTIEVSESIAKRQHVIGLYEKWQGTEMLSPARLDESAYATQIVNVVNLLGLTAALWKYEVVERRIIAQNYWEPFDSLYNVLAGRETEIESVKKSGTALLTPDIRLTHSQMKALAEEIRKEESR